jgi:hypothetical protein
VQSSSVFRCRLMSLGPATPRRVDKVWAAIGGPSCARCPSPRPSTTEVEETTRNDDHDDVVLERRRVSRGARESGARRGASA